MLGNTRVIGIVNLFQQLIKQKYQIQIESFFVRPSVLIGVFCSS